MLKTLPVFLAHKPKTSKFAQILTFNHGQSTRKHEETYRKGTR